MSSGRLPAELYREIVQNTQCRAVLVQLMRVSRLLSYEAERVLYRTITIEVNPDEPRRGKHSRGAIHAKKFSHYKRVARHIQSATFSFYEDCSKTTLHRVFNPILLSLTNLKALTLKFNFFNPCNTTPFVHSLPEKVPFHLFQLTINSYKNDQAMIPFVRSQSSLRKLSWTPWTDKVSISVSDLPHLTTLASGHPTLIQSILAGRNVIQLDCRRGTPYLLNQQFGPGASYPSVQALVLPFIHDLDRIPEIFPAVQYLFIDLWRVNNLDESLLPHLNLFKHLNRLKLTIPIDITSSRTFASEVFACNKLITIAELYIEGALLKFKRGFEKNESLVSSERVATVHQLDPW